FTLTKSILLMLLFAILMIFTSYSLIKKEKDVTDEPPQKQQFNYLLILIEGTLVGILTGLVAAGGGFLIIPARVLLNKLPVKEAVGTSFVIVAAKSLIGFVGESGEAAIDWLFLLKVSAYAIIGVFMGMSPSQRANAEKLKPAFGWF